MAMVLSSTARAEAGEDAVFEDQPFLELYVIRWRVALRFLLIFSIPTLAVFIRFPGYGAAAGLLCVVVHSFRISRLCGDPQAVRTALKGESWGLGAFLGILLVCQGLAYEADGIPVIGFLVRCGYLFVAAATAVAFLFIFDGKEIIRRNTRPTYTVSRAVVADDDTDVETDQIEVISTDKLREKRAKIEADLQKLKTLKVFNPRSRALEEAWERRSAGSIEAILRSGDKLTRSSRTKAIRVYNAAARSVDVVRDRLGELVTATEAALDPYQIDYATIDMRESKVLVGYARKVSLPAKTLSQKLDYGQGFARVLNESMRGNLPWPVAAAAFAAVLAMLAINHSKALRQLKDMQGKIATNAKTVKGEIAMLRTYLMTRIIPHYDGMLEIIDHLESELANLKAIAGDMTIQNDDRERAFQLACSLVEAKRFLEMTAED